MKRVPIRTRVVFSEQDAEELGFVGSPTIRIDGIDPFEGRGMATGLACRVYVERGLRSGLPDLGKLRQVLKRQAEIDRSSSDRTTAQETAAPCCTETPCPAPGAKLTTKSLVPVLGGGVWTGSWYLMYLEITRWHHVKPSLAFNSDIAPAARPGQPLILLYVACVASPLMVLAGVVAQIHADRTSR